MAPETEPTPCSAGSLGGCGEPAQPEHDPCCSSHGRPLCCRHYTRFHFCEGVCSPGFHAGTEPSPREMQAGG